MRQSPKQLTSIALIALGLLHLVASSLAAQQNGQANGTDHSLLVGAEYVQSYREQNPGLQIVDVRGRHTFERAHIPGAVHVPLGLVPSKSFARNKPLILVGSGAVPDRLLRICRELRRGGVRASVLWGGIVRWREAGGRLAGKNANSPTLNEVSPATYFRQRKKGFWRVLYVGEQKPVDLASAMPKAEYVPRESRLVSHLDHSEEPVLYLLVTRDGEEFHSLKSTLRQRGVHNVFQLKGGFNAYRSHILARKDKTGQQNKQTTNRSSCQEYEEKDIKSYCSKCTK